MRAFETAKSRFGTLCRLETRLPKRTQKFPNCCPLSPSTTVGSVIPVSEEVTLRTRCCTGAVLCVRGSNGDGRFLASGSDDTKIIIWELSGYAIACSRNRTASYSNCSSGGKATFGDLDGATNKEVYRPVKVLMGHESGTL